MKDNSPPREDEPILEDEAIMEEEAAPPKRESTLIPTLPYPVSSISCR